VTGRWGRRCRCVTGRWCRCVGGVGASAVSVRLVCSLVRSLGLASEMLAHSNAPTPPHRRFAAAAGERLRPEAAAVGSAVSECRRCWCVWFARSFARWGSLPKCSRTQTRRRRLIGVSSGRRSQRADWRSCVARRLAVAACERLRPEAETVGLAFLRRGAFRRGCVRTLEAGG